MLKKRKMRRKKTNLPEASTEQKPSNAIMTKHLREVLESLLAEFGKSMIPQTQKPEPFKAIQFLPLKNNGFSTSYLYKQNHH